MVSKLSTVLKGITNNEISGRSVAFAVAAVMTPPRPDCVTENTSRTVESAQLCNAFLDELLSTVLLMRRKPDVDKNPRKILTGATKETK